MATRSIKLFKFTSTDGRTATVVSGTSKTAARRSMGGSYRKEVEIVGHVEDGQWVYLPGVVI